MCRLKTRRVGPIERTFGGSPAIFQKLQLFLHNQCETNSNNLPRHTLVSLSTDRAHTTVHQRPAPHTSTYGPHTRGPPLTGSTHEHTRASHPRFTGLRAYTTQVCTGTGDCGPSSDTNCWHKNQESRPNGAHTRRKSCYTPKASPRGERLPPLLCWFNSPPQPMWD